MWTTINRNELRMLGLSGEIINVQLFNPGYLEAYPIKSKTARPNNGYTTHGLGASGEHGLRSEAVLTRKIENLTA